MIEEPTVETCDDAAVHVIVEGKFTPSYEGIGRANIPTLHKAVQKCLEAESKALGAGLPCSQYYYRSLVCRRRLARLQAEEKAAVHP